MHTAQYAVHPDNTRASASIPSGPCHFVHVMFWVRSHSKWHEPLNISEMRWCLHPMMEPPCLLHPMDYLHHLVLIFSHHVYHRTVLTGLWLPYWTYALSRYLAAVSCSHTFLNRMMFTQSHDPHCPVSLTPLHTISCARESVRLLYLQTLLLLTIHMTAHLSAHYCAAVPTPFCLRIPILYNNSYLNCFT